MRITINVYNQENAYRFGFEELQTKGVSRTKTNNKQKYELVCGGTIVLKIG